MHKRTILAVPALMEDDVATVRVLVDRPIHELVGGNGASTETSTGGQWRQANQNGDGNRRRRYGETIASLGIYELQSAWKSSAEINSAKPCGEFHAITVRG